MKLLRRIIIITLTAVMSLGVITACDVNANRFGDADLTGYVAVDINPGVEFLTDKNGTVTDVRAVNQAAQILLSDMNLVGKSLDKAVEEITRSAEQTGYLNDANTDVSITVAGETAAGEEALGTLASEGVEKGSDKAVIKDDEVKKTFEAEAERMRQAGYEHMNAVKLRIINSIMELDRNFTVEQGNEMTVKELIRYLDELIDQNEDDIEAQYEEKLYELSALIYPKLDAVFGEGFGEKLALLTRLEILEEKYENELELTHGEQRFHFGRDFDDEEALPLTEAMVTELTELVGTHTMTTLGDLDAYIDRLEDEVEYVVETTQLTPEQRAELAAIREELSLAKAQAHEYIKPLVEQMANEFIGHKQELIEGNAKPGDFFHGYPDFDDDDDDEIECECDDPEDFCPIHDRPAPPAQA